MKKGWPPLLACLAVVLCAGSAASGQVGASVAAPGVAAAPATPLRPPVPPPGGASPARRGVLPSGQIGSSYLHVRVWTYRAALPSAAVIAYYTRALQALGYATAGEGYSGDRQGITSYDEMYARGADTVFLTVLPDVRGVSRYSVALDRIELPARPASSLVPHGVSVLEIAVQVGTTPRWRRRTITAPVQIASIRRIVNGLAVFDPGGRMGCLAMQRTAILRFIAAVRSYTFTENASCLSVAAPGGATLSDTDRYALWRAAERAVGMRE